MGVIGNFTFPIKGEYYDNLLAAQAAARGHMDRARQRHLFDRLDWLSALHRTALRAHRPLFLRALDGEHEAWLPLMMTGAGRGAALANWYNFAFRPIFSGAYDEATKIALLRQVALSARPHARRINLDQIPGEDGSAALLQIAFEQAGWVVAKRVQDENHYLALNGRNFDEYWRSRPGPLRSTVKRKGRKNIVSIRIIREFDDQSWSDYEQVYARSWKPSEGSPEFLRAIAKQESAAGCLRLGLAYIDGKPAAAQFWTVENGMALIHKLAHDEDYADASPGTLLSAALFQHVIDIDQVDEIDFGTGGDGYKRDWMEQCRMRYRLDIYWPNHLLNWPHIIRHKLRAARAQKE